MLPTRALTALLLLAAPAAAQVHYFPSGHPWSQQANGGPDAVVPGWFYNLGITGLRVELREERPKAMLVRFVFPGSPAAGRVQPGEWLVGVDGQAFQEAHQNGYGMDVFGARGPVGELAPQLEHAQSAAGSGRLRLLVEGAGGAQREEVLAVGQAHGAFSPTFPDDCPKSERLLDDLLDFLVQEQNAEGSWGNPVNDLFATLALLSLHDTPARRQALERSVQRMAATTSATDSGGLINWRYMTAGIVLSEYHLATDAAWVLPELEEVRDFLAASQYTRRSQINPAAQTSHPHTFPDDEMDSHGGWGHNPGFEGYGPIGMITGMGALAFSLMERCGVAIDREAHDFAYAFLARGTGHNGYVWYKDEVAGHQSWADHGRTSASALANQLAPYPEARYRQRAQKHRSVIAAHPESFPDTHGSPQLGMGLAVAAAVHDPATYRALLDANRWWFALAHCTDGTFVYQPNRDNAMYGADSRVSASAVTAFMLATARRDLAITGAR